MKQNYEIVLEHHGVKGMKWGVRKQYKQLERSGVSAMRKSATGMVAASRHLKSSDRAKKVSKTTASILGRSNIISRGASTYSKYKYKKAEDSAKYAQSEAKKAVKSIEKASKLNPKIKLQPKVTKAIHIAKQVFMDDAYDPTRGAIFALNDKHAFRELVNEKQKESNKRR